MNMQQQRFSIRTPINYPMGSNFSHAVSPTGLPGADLALQMGARNSTSTVVGDAYANEMGWLKEVAS